MLDQGESPQSCVELQKEAQQQGLSSPCSALMVPACESGPMTPPSPGRYEPKAADPSSPSLAISRKGILGTQTFCPHSKFPSLGLSGRQTSLLPKGADPQPTLGVTFPQLCRLRHSLISLGLSIPICKRVTYLISGFQTVLGKDTTIESEHRPPCIKLMTDQLFQIIEAWVLAPFSLHG